MGRLFLSDPRIPMLQDSLTSDLLAEISKIPLIDPHSHINPKAPTARSLDDILGYHYYTELAHSAGMSQAPLAASVDPRERTRALLEHLDRLDNTVQYSWFLEIAHTFLEFHQETLTAADAVPLWEKAVKVFALPDWEQQVFERTNLEKIFLTNEFDDDLEGFDTNHYVPCLRTDTLVFGTDWPVVHERLARVTGIEISDQKSIRQALHALFERFVRHGARACAISLPPNFAPKPQTLSSVDDLSPDAEAAQEAGAQVLFWMLAECCRDFNLPFDLMIGVNRRVYNQGVYQGQDLFDQRTSLIQYAELFNAFPEVTFCVSVLSSGQNQELVSYSWIFPNVVSNGHWWYSNIPAYIQMDCRARLQAVPKTKQLGYYSDAYKLEFVLPKYNMYRRVLAQVLADDFVRPGLLREPQAVALARQVLRDNVQRIFRV
jgi:glucuronate isomerase